MELKPSLYVSTRGGIQPVDFEAAVMMGLADDGGLLVPAMIPHYDAELVAPRILSLPPRRFRIFSKRFPRNWSATSLNASVGPW